MKLKSRHDAFCTVCLQSFKLGTVGVAAVDSHGEKYQTQKQRCCEKSEGVILFTRESV